MGADRLKRTVIFLLILVMAISTVTCAKVAPAPIERGGWSDRYIRYKGDFTFLVGMDLQQLVSDSSLDYKSLIDWLSRYDINKVRIWGIVDFLDQYGENLYPYAYDPTTQKFDLLKWDEKYWHRLDTILKYADRKGIVVEISIFAITGPLRFFGELKDRRYPFRNIFNKQNWGTPNQSGTLIPEFFDLDYQERGISAQSLQKALIDKYVEETADNPNVYFEIMNEFPGSKASVLNPKLHLWQKEMARYLSSRSNKLVTVHPHGFGYRRTTDELEASSALYWDEPCIDGLNFHLYIYDPNRISELLNGHQLKGKMLINNEGRGFYRRLSRPAYPAYDLVLDDKKLAEEIRASWGHVTAGGYYLMYFGPVPAVGDSVWQHGAKAAQAQRRIMETLAFWNLRPVKDNGKEYDTIVLSGPAKNWQVLADEGQGYLVYFWGEKTGNPVKMIKPDGRYAFNYFDTREWKKTLLAGEVGGDIPVPPSSSWSAETGVVLTLKRLKAE